MIFIDTWAWAALASRRDPYHAAATLFMEHVIGGKQRLVTTNLVLTETITGLFPAVGSGMARRYVESIFETEAAGFLTICHATKDHFAASWQLRIRYADKPGISFTDLTSMVVMQELGITDILTGDAHFEHVGLGFRRVPAV